MIPIMLPTNLDADLQQVMQIIRERIHARSAVMRMSGASLPERDQLVRAGLVLLTARLGSYRSEQVIHAAAAAELIYAASGTHDDLIDPVDRRRGVVASGDWDHGVTLMVGDYLFALAAGEMALSPDPRVIGYYAEAVQRITESALTPLTELASVETAYEQYIERAFGATAALIAAACRAGAACGGLSDPTIDLLGNYGRALGLATHLATELLALRQATGPWPAVISLPMIYAAAHVDPARMLAALDSSDPAEQQWASDAIRTYGFGPARAEVERLIAAAQTLLADLPAGEARSALDDLALQIGTHL